MKILQYIPSLKCAGAEVMCRNLTMELLKLGHTIEIIVEYDCSSDIVEELSQHVKIHFLGKKKGFDPSIIRKSRKIIKKFSPDVIHTHLDAIKYACISSLFLNIPIIHTVHNIAQYESSGIAMKMNRFLFKRKIAIPVALSTEIQDTILICYKMLREKVPVVLNGVNVDQITVKQLYSVTAEKFKIVHVAAFRPQKNHKFFLQIIKELSLIRQDFEVFFYGEGPLLEECKEYALSLDINSYVHFMGVDSHITNKLYLYDIFVLPSKYEGLPMTILEAMSAGMPVVASPVGGIPDIVQNGINGVLCDQSKEAYIDGIMKLLNDEKLRQSIGENARLSALCNYGADVMAKKYEEVYYSVKGLANKEKQ